MKNVKVKAMGLGFALVAKQQTEFSGESIAASFDLDAHQPHTTGFFRGKAIQSTPAKLPIVLA